MVINTAVNLYLTWRCNLQCDHCQYSCHPNEEKHMTDEQLKYAFAVLEEFKKSRYCKISVIGVSGGEPILHPKFWEVVERLAAMKSALMNSFPLELHTNGTQPIQDEMISRYPHIFDTAFVGNDAYHEAQNQQVKLQSLSKLAKIVLIRRAMLQNDTSASWIRLMGRAKEKFEGQTSELTKHCYLSTAMNTNASVCFTPDCIKFCGEIGREEYLPHNSAEYGDASEMNEESFKELITKSMNYCIHHSGTNCQTPCMHKIARMQ